MAKGKQPKELKKPNGERVTTKDVALMLYTLDQGLSQRFSIILESLNGVRTDISAHIRDGHAGVAEALASKADKKDVDDVVTGFKLVRRAVQFASSRPGIAVIAIILGAPLAAQWSQLAPELMKVFGG